MKIKNATILFVLIPFILGTFLLVYCIWAVSTNKNYTIKDTISAGSAKLVWYTEKVKNTDVPVTHVQCIGSRKIFDPHQEHYDIFIAEGTPTLSFVLVIGASGDADTVIITIDAQEGFESGTSSSQPTGIESEGGSSNPVRIIRQKTEAHGITFVWK